MTRQGQPVPLSGVDIRADVSSLGARVTIAQRYVNRESAPIEAVYVFPLDERSAVCGFEALIDGTLVVGEIRTRDEAFEAYDEAMRAAMARSCWTRSGRCLWRVSAICLPARRCC